MSPTIIDASTLLREADAEAVIFDMDGVLASNEAEHLEAWARLLETHSGSRPPHDIIRATFGQSNDDIIPALWERAGLEPPGVRLAELSREKEEHYRDAARGRVRPTPGLETFLDWLAARGLPLAIGTSAPLENVDFLLDEFAWRDRFVAVAHRATFARGKPAPDCFLEAARRLGSRPARTIVFEDSIHGLEAARAGGFPACAVATGEPVERLRPLGRWVIRDFTEIASER